MPDPVDHGPRLSGDEYDRRTVALYEGTPEVPTREQRRDLRRREFDLTIDHRLGCDFPPDRREALWAIHERCERRRLALMLRHAVRRLWPGGVERGAQGLAGYLVDEYAKVLTAEELKQYFGEAEAREPRLPNDREGRG